ncbi:hypothetical protein V1509DRAFT_633203 [Lipomyces kononenkoae]
MRSRSNYLLDLDPVNTRIKREVGRSEASSIFEIELHDRCCAMKLVSMESSLINSADVPVP